ncbi:hypothetical protein ACFE04_000127 [Oxalis oulophora]
MIEEMNLLSQALCPSTPLETGKKRKVNSIQSFSGVKDNSQVVQWKQNEMVITSLGYWREQTRMSCSAGSNEKIIFELLWLGRPWAVHVIAQLLRRERPEDIEGDREISIARGSWIVGNGKEIVISTDNWMIWKSKSRVLMNTQIVVLLAHVCDLLHGPRRCWNVNLLRAIISEEQVEAMICLSGM